MGALSSLRSFFESVSYVCNWLGSMWIFVMMLIIVADVLFRYAGFPLSGPYEIVQASIVVILYLQIAHTLKEGRMTRSDAFYRGMRRSAPKFGALLGVIHCLAGAFFAGVICYLAWFKWVEAWERDYFIGAHGVFTFPEWPILFSIFFGSALLFIQFVLMVFDEVRPDKKDSTADNNALDGGGQ